MRVNNIRRCLIVRVVSFFFCRSSLWIRKLGYFIIEMRGVIYDIDISRLFLLEVSMMNLKC